MILIIIKFCELLIRISPRIINSLRSYIKHSKKCFLPFPNTSKLVKKKKLGCASFFQVLLGVWKSEETLFLVFDILLEYQCIYRRDQNIFVLVYNQSHFVIISQHVFLEERLYLQFCFLHHANIELKPLTFRDSILKSQEPIMNRPQ